MQLVIAEKPLLGKAIADAIPGRGKEAGTGVIEKQWQGDAIKIAWCFGHLLELKPPEEYDPKYKHWALEDLPIYFPGWEKRPPAADASKQARVKQLGALLKEATCVIHAGDLDDEGQCIVDELLDYFHYRGPVKRLDTRDITPGALKHALANMDDNAGHRPDGTAAYARQVCDALFGFNLSRYYTLINQNATKMTVGRVQTPALGLVVRRDMAIANHTKQMYYTLYVDLLVNGVKVRAKFVPDKNNEHLEDGLILDKNYLQEVASKIAGKTLNPCEISVSQISEAPPLPFNTTKLNSYCGSRFGMSPIQVLNVTQSLRDSYKAISYNRSECPYLSMELHKEAPQTIAAAAGNLGIDTKVYGFDATIVSRAFDDSKVGAHMGIIPTAISIDAKAKFKENERRVYEAIALHYLVQFMPPAKKEMTKLVILLPGYGSLTATASSYIQPGYRTLLKGAQEPSENEDGEDTGNDALRSVKPGQYSAAIQGSEIKEAETKPPAKYTQSTLAEDMTRIAKYCTNAKVKELLLKKDKDKTGENGSIGTEATRPAIIAGLITHGLLREISKGKKKYIEATDKGRELYSILPENIKGVDVTAKWWCFTEDIKLGQYTPEQMAQNVLMTVKAVIASGAGKIDGIEKIARDAKGPCIGKCPKCGGDVYENSRGFSCTAPGCKFIIWKDNNLFKAIGKQLTPKIASMFLSKGRVGLKNCKSASKGTIFDTILVADFSGDRVQFNFENADSKEPIGKCPRCGASVFEKGRKFECENEQCEFALWKSNAFLDSICKTLTLQDAATLMSTGRLEVKNAKSKKKGTVIKRCIVTVDFTQTPFKWGIEFPK